MTLTEQDIVESAEARVVRRLALTGPLTQPVAMTTNPAGFAHVGLVADLDRRLRSVAPSGLVLPTEIEGATLDFDEQFTETTPSPFNGAQWPSRSRWAVWGPANAGGGQDDEYEGSQVHVANGKLAIVCRQTSPTSRISGGVGSCNAPQRDWALYIVVARIISNGSIDSVIGQWPDQGPWPRTGEKDSLECNPLWDGTSFGSHLHWGGGPNGMTNEQAGDDAPSGVNVGLFHAYWCLVSEARMATYVDVDPRQGALSIMGGALACDGAVLTPTTNIPASAGTIVDEDGFLFIENLAQGPAVEGSMVIERVQQWAI